ncbi:unnamed protein product [Adineta steineri]|uniref:Transmembrane protein 120-like protein n=1 Tax=Adineta steineri TaxID=433720 RepID=A0A813M5R4_9BILA|nr:unnamed protein product [Adineta steineri]CAF0759509.1 unnamed protein product [Adineta steineri]CAF3682471.1 unnamed protein product [Adineta steineri]CAF4043367.1 unnamed protein product [Adineta steineri]
MTSDPMFVSGNEEKRHFDLGNSGDEEEEEEDQPLSSSPGNSNDDEQMIIKNKVETFEDKKLTKLYDNWLEFDAEIRAFEPKHKEYVQKLDEVESLKTIYRNQFNKYNKKIHQLQNDVARLRKSYAKKDEEIKPKTLNSSLKTQKNSQSTANLLLSRNLSSPSSLPSHLRPLTSVNSSPTLDKLVDTLSSAERLNIISNNLNTNELYLSRISDTLPRKDPYLRVILGGVDVSILNKADKWKYKQEYEKFKFIVTCISLVSSLVIWSLTSRYRAFDALFHFLLVWYYCTLTIRESILIVNGSNINPWWRAHHFIATVATGILLTWPESPSYQAFRTQFFVFSFYLSFVQGLQFYYQRGCLYRLRALGETHDMDITIEGFHQWMFRGLSFLVPFLLVGYLFQLFNAYSLWQLAHESSTHEWQVYVLSIVFFILFLGNILTTLSVLRDKVREKTRPALLKQKYQSFKTFLSTNYHRRSRSYNLQRNREHPLTRNEEIQKISKED